MEHDGWLLIFDNADDLTLVEDFLPASESGALLLTTRNQAPGALANPIDIAQMDRHEGTLLLLRRAKRLPPDATLEQASPDERALAEQIVQEMDGLPLAIDQAAAYLEETRSNLANYLKAYQHRRMDLLQERGSDPYRHTPVATTWSLNFEQVEQRDRAASDLLHVLAFLAPDAIPEDLLIAGAGNLGPSLEGIARMRPCWTNRCARSFGSRLCNATPICICSRSTAWCRRSSVPGCQTRRDRRGRNGRCVP